MAGFSAISWHPRGTALAGATAALFVLGFAGGLRLVPSGHDQVAAAPVGAAVRPAAPAVAAAPAPAAPAVSTADAKRYLPLYRQAAREFGVNWLLIASIHSQETAFSSAADSYHGLNFAHCCAGPMQFNVKNGKPSTWVRFRDAYTRGPRPASYPHATARHPSVYDDYDAIMAAGSLLQENGAGQALDGSAWSAAYEYYGPGDVAAVDYANQVLARATIWQQTGFDPATAPDPALVANFESAYGAALREQVTAKPPAHSKHHAAKHRAHASKPRRHEAPRPTHHHRSAPQRHAPQPSRDTKPQASGGAAAGRPQAPPTPPSS